MEGLKQANERHCLDFNQVHPFYLELDTQLLADFHKGCLLKVFRNYPVKKYKPQIDEKKEPEFDIELRSDMLGFCVLDFQSLADDDMKQVLQLKYPLFEYENERTTAFYNIYWPHKEEGKRVSAQSELIHKLRNDKYKKEEETDKTGKGKKPEIKKKKPVVQTGKKGQNAEEPKVDIPKWEKNSREVIAYTEDVVGKYPVDEYSLAETKFLVAGEALFSVELRLS